MCSLLIAAMLAAAPPEVEVQTLDGRTLSGPIVELDSEKATVETAEGRVSLAIQKLMGLAPKQKPAAAEDAPGAQIELVDGSSLAARKYTVSKGRARIALSDQQTVELPTESVQTARLQPHADEVAAEWSRIVGMETRSDLLVVRKDDNLDYHKGVVRDVTESVVQFELDGEVLPVKRSKVYGLVYHRAATGKLPETICRITDAGGSQWSVRSLSLSGELKWTTPSGVTVSRPLLLLSQLDFSRGKVVYLGDLKMESVKWTPYFGTAKGLPIIEQFYSPRKDTNLASKPLLLAGQRYEKGLALHSRTEVVYRLPGRFSRFKATAGIDDGVRPHGNVRLVIRGDEKVLLETALGGTDPPRQIDLDLSGVRRLGVLVDFGEELDVADHLNLCNARIIK